MENAKIRPLATPKPLYRSSQKLAGVIIYWVAPGTQNFVTIGSGVSVLQIRDFAVPLRWLVFSFWGFFNIDVDPGKEVPFGDPDDYILYLDP